MAYSTRECAVCGVRFQANSSTQKNCTKDCAKQAKALWSAARYQQNLEEMRRRSREYAKANPDKARARSKKYEAAHRAERNARPRDKDKRAAQFKAWYDRNKEAQQLKAREWSAQNLDRKRLAMQKRRAQKRRNGVFRVTEKDLQKAVARARNECTYCGELIETLHFDHVIPIVRGGQHSVGNLMPACALCNQSKREKTVMEWRLARIRRAEQVK